MVIVFILYFYYNVHMLDLTGLFLYITHLNQKKKKNQKQKQRETERDRDIHEYSPVSFTSSFFFFFFIFYSSEIAGRFFTFWSSRKAHWFLWDSHSLLPTVCGAFSFYSLFINDERETKLCTSPGMYIYQHRKKILFTAITIIISVIWWAKFILFARKFRNITPFQWFLRLYLLYA